MSLYRDEAIVLRTQKLGEADRIVTLLTREHGKVRAVAKGVRRTSSRFGSRLDVYLPQGVAPLVATGQSMVAGETVLADLDGAPRVEIGTPAEVVNKIHRDTAAVLAYIFVITTMVALSAGTVAARGPLLAGAAVLFFASDLAVARHRFVERSSTNKVVGLPLYYAAQLLFALFPVLA